jgi:CheY-like chemotaxis protein
MNNLKNVLIVDDEPYMLRIVEITLARAGFSVRKAENGREALEAIDQAHPDLLIMDVLMPEMDGIQALLELKKRNLLAQFPIILLTAKGHPVGNEELISDSKIEMMTKPFSPIELQQAAARLTSDPTT